MSKPTIEKPENPVDRCQSVNNLIESIALMEVGLSHIINAEGEKIQKVVSTDPDNPATIDDIYKINESVSHTIDSIAKLEMVLQSKLESAKSLDKCCKEPDCITEVSFSAHHSCGGCIKFNNLGTPIVLDLLSYLNNVTVSSDKTTFTVAENGKYLINYSFFLGEMNCAPFFIALEVNNKIAENTRILIPINSDKIKQIYNSVILDLTAGSSIKLVIANNIVATETRMIVSGAGTGMTLTKVSN